MPSDDGYLGPLGLHREHGSTVTVWDAPLDKRGNGLFHRPWSLSTGSQGDSGRPDLPGEVPQTRLLLWLQTSRKVSCLALAVMLA